MDAQSPSLETILFANARASAHFALSCLEPFNGHLRAKSSFVKPDGAIMHWHDFGDLEGPGWAANAVGGAYLLWRWGCTLGDASMEASALALLDHVLDDGFIDAESGFIRPYYELAQQRFCLNYVHADDWLCPGSLAKIGVQVLEFADELEQIGKHLHLRRSAAQVQVSANQQDGETANSESRLTFHASRPCAPPRPVSPCGCSTTPP